MLVFLQRNESFPYGLSLYTSFLRRDVFPYIPTAFTGAGEAAIARLEGTGRTAALIDAKSIAEYKKQFEDHRMQNIYATDAEILEHVKEYIKKKIDGMVKEACHKRVMDITTVAMAIASSSVVPFSGVAVVVAATIMQSLDFSATLGLIEQHQDVTCSEGDVKDMSSQIGNRIRDNGSSIQAGVETAVLEALKSESKSQLKSEQGQELQQWLYDEILKDILADMLCTAAMDCAWIMTPILAVPKYMMHRHLIKRMYHKLGDKARVAHCTWTEQNFVVTTVQTTVVSQVAVDANGNIQAATVKAAQEVLNGAGVQQISMTSSTYLQQQGLTSPSKRLPGQRPKRSSLFAYCFCTRGSAVDAEDKDM